MSGFLLCTSIIASFKINSIEMMYLESLPNELLSLIFCYLHKFDLFHGFTNLNQRFEQLIGSPLYDIDFTDGNKPSYRLWKLFSQRLLRFHGQHIRSLKLVGEQQIQLVQPYIDQFIHLKSLQINNLDEDDFDHVLRLKPFLIKALSIRSLRHLSICYATDDVFKTIASQNLQTLTLIYPRSLGLPDLVKIRPMSNIKCFSVNITSIKRLMQVFDVMPNLEELNLSMIDFEDLMNNFKVPQRLEKLHVECGCYHCCTNFKTIKTFLNIFKANLRSLTLISVNAEEDFSNFDKFHSLVSDFPHLQTFQYSIRTMHQSNSISLFPNVEHLLDGSYLFFTQPCPQQFDSTTKGTVGSEHCNLDLTLSKLFNCHTLWVYGKEIPTSFVLTNDLQFPKLRKIEIETRMRDITIDLCRYVSNVISLSPNFTYLQMSMEHNPNLIKHLSQIVPIKQKKQITSLELGISMINETYDHRTFLSELSNILPNLETLHIVVDHKHSIGDFPLNEFITSLRIYFRKLSRLLIQTWSEGDNKQKKSERFKNDTIELSEHIGNSVYYTINCHIDNGDYLNIWL